MIHLYYVSLPLFLLSLFLHSCESVLALCLALISRTRQKWYAISKARPQEALQLPISPSWSIALRHIRQLVWRMRGHLEEKQGAQPRASTNCHSCESLPSQPSWSFSGCSSSTTALVEPAKEQPSQPSVLWAIINCCFMLLSFRVVRYRKRLSISKVLSFLSNTNYPVPDRILVCFTPLLVSLHCACYNPPHTVGTQ